ncbi:MAG: type II toxin-antitoxin system HipA family toxin [Verrucomicrobiales bacterium]|nr:type II toxin-antitoxin system HipA family toxin [Verrucomicrobiales bacterium]
MLTDEAKPGVGAFQYAGSYAGPSPSPLKLPVSPGLQYPQAETDGLHGVFKDSLPDAFGMNALELWFKQHHREAYAVTKLEKLAYMGNRAWGALSYHPDLGKANKDFVCALHEIALAQAAKQTLEGKFDEVAPLFLQIASSIGGARPKVTIGIDPDNPQNVVMGALKKQSVFEPWVLKIDTAPDRQYGRIEHVYNLLAGKAGILTNESRVLEEVRDGKKYSHFASRRFDRDGGRKIHAITLAGLLDVDFNKNETTYETLMLTALRLTRNLTVCKEFYRRGIFNYLAGNHDDHAKNHALLMNENGAWSASPAYDITPSTGMERREVHAMSISDSIKATSTKEAWEKLGIRMGFGKQEVRQIFEQVDGALAQWKTVAAENGIAAPVIAQVKAYLARHRAF